MRAGWVDPLANYGW